MPKNPKIYHITHVDNLDGILSRGGLLSDARILAEGGPKLTIGMGKIKWRRLNEIYVPCHSGTKVGEYVPFYYCPRSVMLYLMYRGNHPELDYSGGQEPILHLEIDLYEAISWAKESGTRWALSFSNAGAYHAEFGCVKEDLSRLDWEAINATDFRDSDIREKKQAEFLVYGYFPFELVSRIGVFDSSMRWKVADILSKHKIKPAPQVSVMKAWYY